MSASQYRLYSLLQRAAHCLKTEADAELTRAGGMTTAQAAMMMIVLRDGPVTQKHVAITLSQGESAITAMATRLLAAGYIVRRRSEMDARAWLLEATPEGRAAMEPVRAPFEAINARIDACFDDRDMMRFAIGLERLIAAFDRDATR